MKTVYHIIDHVRGPEDLGQFEAESKEAAKIMAIKKKYPDIADNMIEAAAYYMEAKYVSGYKDETKIVRCTKCSGEFSDIEIEGVSKCPGCGTKGVPMSIAEDVTVNINWHELRILSIWAENWARKCDRDADERGDKTHENMLLTVMCIAERLQKQHPDKTALTLFSEVRDLRKTYDIQTNIDDDNKLGL